MKRFEVHRRAAEILLADLRGRAELYYDGVRGYCFVKKDGLLLPIERGNQDLELVLADYGLQPSEEIHRYAIDALRLAAVRDGKRSDVYPFTHYDASAGVLYVSDLRRGMYRIDSDTLTRENNGRDGVLFLHNPGWTPIEARTRLTGDSLFDRLILGPIRIRGGTLRAEDRRLLLRTWFYSLFFPELFPTRPILALIGELGSGKSSTLRKFGQLLFGPSFNVMQLSEDPKDFDASVTNEHLVAIDNADSSLKWLDDRLAVVATGGTIKRREYYTTNGLVEYRIRAYLGITSRTPHFRREDVADRLLIVPLERYETFLPEAELLRELLVNRDRIMTEVLWDLCRVVAALRAGAGKPCRSGFRMADFAAFALKTARSEEERRRMARILEKTAEEQHVFALENEPIAELLDEWLKAPGGRNVGREVGTSELCKELGECALVREIDFPYRGKTIAFGQRLSNLMGSLRHRFQIGERTGGGGRRLLTVRPVDDGRGASADKATSSLSSPPSPQSSLSEDVGAQAVRREE